MTFEDAVLAYFELDSSHAVEVEIEDEGQADEENNPLAEWERELLKNDTGTPPKGEFEISVSDLVSFSAPDKTYTFKKDSYTVILSARVSRGPAKHWAQLF